LQIKFNQRCNFKFELYNPIQKHNNLSLRWASH
jgi:hypothetical protein